jgi:hypothetical protein
MPLLHIDDAIERLVSYLHEEITTPPWRRLMPWYGEQFRVAPMRVRNALYENRFRC